MPWMIKRGNNYTEVIVKDAKEQAKGFVAKLKNCDDRDQAALYTNMEIAVYRDQLPAAAADEYYWHDLVGLEVVNQNQIVLGKIDHVFNAGANDVLSVKGEREHLIPYIKDQTVLKVDLANGLMQVDWDEDF